MEDAGDDLDTSATPGNEREHAHIAGRLSRLSEPLRRRRREMRMVGRIDKACCRTYGRGRSLTDWLTLPWRLRRRHEQALLGAKTGAGRGSR